MELIGKLKDKVAKAETSEEAKEVIEEAGMKLTDDMYPFYWTNPVKGVFV